MTDPLWKTVLNWGTVITFFTLPAVEFSLQLWNWSHPGFLTPTVVEGKLRIQYLIDFQRNITVLVFGLAGLRTWEQIKANGQKKLDKA